MSRSFYLVSKVFPFLVYKCKMLKHSSKLERQENMQDSKSVRHKLLRHGHGCNKIATCLNLLMSTVSRTIFKTFKKCWAVDQREGSKFIFVTTLDFIPPAQFRICFCRRKSPCDSKPLRTTLGIVCQIKIVFLSRKLLVQKSSWDFIRECAARQFL